MAEGGQFHLAEGGQFAWVFHYTHKKGLGNNTNIFPSQVREFPLPEISLAEQDKVVTAIKMETDKQRVFVKKIKLKKEEINTIIQDATIGSI